MLTDLLLASPLPEIYLAWWWGGDSLPWKTKHSAHTLALLSCLEGSLRYLEQGSPQSGNDLEEATCPLWEGHWGLTSEGLEGYIKRTAQGHCHHGQ